MSTTYRFNAPTTTFSGTAISTDDLFTVKTPASKEDSRHTLQRVSDGALARVHRRIFKQVLTVVSK